MRKNRIELRDGMLKPVGPEEWEEEVDVVFQAIGIVGFDCRRALDERRGIIPNCEGRVLTGPSGCATENMGGLGEETLWTHWDKWPRF